MVTLHSQGRIRLDAAWTSVVLFIAVYCAVVAAAFFAAPPASAAEAHAIGLLAVTLATVLAALLVERAVADPALFVAKGRAVRDGLAGFAIGTTAVLAGHAAALLSSELVTRGGAGFPWAALTLTIAPAVLHEELLFRGYAFQKLLAWRPAAAIALSSAVFAALHAGNRHVGPIAFANLALAGVLLALVFQLYRTLWAPLGAHLAWNVVSGPILGHEISGWNPPSTLFAATDPGPAWATGGDFGIEASVWMTVVQLLAIAWLAWRIRNGPGFGPVDTIRYWKKERNPA